MAGLLTRRRLLGIFGGLGVSAVYPLLEARWLRVTRCRIALPRLPQAFSGLRIGFLADFHHSSSVSRSFIRRAVDLANAERPDIILLGGDYVSWNHTYTEACIDTLSALSAPMHVYAVLGNHDGWQKPEVTRTLFQKHGIRELRNRGVWLERGGSRLRLGGVGDLWTDKQDLAAALGDMRSDEGAVLLSHNPDFAEILDSDRVDLILSGHTHGGQVRIPPFGAPIIPSRYGQKYAFGLVRGPRCLVYVTTGIGTIGPPVRLSCRPEINVIELARA